MNKILISSLSIIIALASFAGGAAYESIRAYKYYTSQTNVAENDTIFNGMYFSSEYVVDWFYYDANNKDGGLFFIVYDDIDAGCDNEIIRVSKSAYNKIVNHIDGVNNLCESTPLTGALEFANGRYSLVADIAL